MELDLLRCSLRGVAAYKHLMDEPVMQLVMSMLDALHDGKGEEAVERYTRLFYTGPCAGVCRPAGHSDAGILGGIGL